MRNGRLYLIYILLLSLLLCACGNTKKAAYGDMMPEMEQLKYENTLKKLESIYAKAGKTAKKAASPVYEEIRRLNYDFNSERMGENAVQKCRTLKERIDALKRHPETVFQHSGNESVADSETLSEHSECKGTLVSRKNIRLSAPQRFPCYLNADDIVTVTLDCQGDVKASFYDIHQQKRIRQWNANSPMSDSIAIDTGGIYMLELSPANSEAVANLTMSYRGTDTNYHRRVQEKLVACRKGDFLSQAIDSVLVTSVFKEPKKVALRGNLKSMFSGKSRVVVPVAIPSGCNALLYSLRISTNEKTIATDGGFADRLSVASSRVKLFGVNVYEKHTPGSSIIDRLLFSTRPPREEDAFCNMYVLTDAVQAKRFQDETASSGNYRYDVNQSQMGTQSCNGQLLPGGHKTLYLGFENERMRYDNYIWLKVAALTYAKKYVRPVYMAR